MLISINNVYNNDVYCIISLDLINNLTTFLTFLVQIVLSVLVAVVAPSFGSLLPYAYGGAPIGPDGSVLDTPEVAAAKAAHFSQYAYEAARNTLGYTGYAYVPAAYHATPIVAYHAISYGAAPLGADGRVVDTPEVALAKAAHFNAHAQVNTWQSSQL